MLLKVKAPNNKEFTIEAEAAWTMRTLKEKVSAQMEVEAGRLRLIHLGRVPKDDATLESVGMTEGHTVHVVVRPADIPPSGSTSSSPTEPVVEEQDSRQARHPSAPQGENLGIDLGGILRSVMGNLGPAVAGLASAFPSAAPTNSSPDSQTPQPSGDTQTRPSQSQPQQQPQSVPPQTRLRTTVISQQQPPVTGFVVHVHVTPDQLDTLPERLQRFVQRSPNVTVSVHEGPNPSQPTANISSFVQSVVEQAQQQQPQPAQQPPQQAGRAPQPAQPAGGSTAPRQSIAQLAEQCGIRNEPSTNIFEELSNAMTNAMDMADVMKLMQGDWTPSMKVREPLRKYIAKETGQPNPGEEARRTLSRKAARSMCSAIADNEQLARELGRRQREGENAIRRLESLVFVCAQRLIDLTMDDARRNTFPQELRKQIVCFVGQAMDFGNRVLFRNGQQDTDFIVGLSLQHVIRAATEQHHEFAAFAPMGAQVMRGCTQQWYQEYMSRYRQPSDDEVFSVVVPPEPSRQADADALLDEALSEAVPAPTTSTAMSPLQQLQTALRSSTLSPHTQSDIASTVEADLRGMQSAPHVPASAIYNELYEAEQHDLLHPSSAS